MLSDSNLLKSGLIPALKQDDPIAAAGKVIENFLRESERSDRRIFGIGLLDTSGKYLTGFVIDNDNEEKLLKDKYKGMNFHSFKVVDKIVKSGNVMQERLYFRETMILAVGFPVINKGELLGILCFTFKSHEFTKKWGISEEDFLKLDFNSK